MMKRVSIVGCLIFFFSSIFSISVPASEVCLSIYPDSAWGSGAPLAVVSFIQSNSKDYSGGLSFYEWESAPGKWSRYDEMNQSTGGVSKPESILQDFIQPIFRFPFWFGANDGDQIRATFVYSGRNCDTRTVVINPLRKYLEADFLMYEKDYDVFLKATSRNFSDETYFKNLIPKNLNIKLSESLDGEKLVVGKSFFSNRFEISNLIPEPLAQSTLFYFPDSCFSQSHSTEIRSKWWAGREGIFNKSGTCSAKLFFYSKAQGKLLTLYNYGTIDFNVEKQTSTQPDAKAAVTKKTTITCVKGKLTKKVTAVKPKCPADYKVKK